MCCFAHGYPRTLMARKHPNPSLGRRLLPWRGSSECSLSALLQPRRPTCHCCRCCSALLLQCQKHGKRLTVTAELRTSLRLTNAAPGPVVSLFGVSDLTQHSAVL